MAEIEFSVMENAVGDSNKLLPLLRVFEQQYNIHVNLTGITWMQGWAEIAKFGIYGHGPDVSAIGTTWVGSLASMHALRPFTSQEVLALGGENAFFEPSWRSGFLPDDPTPWAIPWLADVMVFYYWRDLLEKGSVKDVQKALSTPEALSATLEKLQKNGIKHPMSLTTNVMSMSVHEAAHWIWSAGGDFMSPDFKRAILNQPEAIKGLQNYFSLKPYLPDESLNMLGAGDLFRDRKAAIMLGGPWFGIAGRQQNPEWNETMGVVEIPGTAYVGGTDFVIWQYSPYAREAFELVCFLSSQPTRIPGSPHEDQLPTRRDALYMPSAESDPFHRALLKDLQTGRSFPTARLWGAVEDKLIVEIGNIWKELFNNPDQDLDACLHRHFDPLTDRLNMVLGN